MAAYGTGSSIPQGWNYNAALDHYEGPNGERLEAYDVMNNGFAYAYMKKYGQSHSVSSAGIANGTMNNLYPASIIAGGATIEPAVQPKPNIMVSTKKGNVTANLETGELTFPPEVGKDQALREFWLGFQEHFQPVNKAQYEQEIKYLKRDLAATKTSAALMKQESEKEASKRVAEKVRKKYGNEKFIMLKPEDLIRFIEG